jgi:hypothetical protein
MTSEQEKSSNGPVTVHGDPPLRRHLKIQTVLGCMDAVWIPAILNPVTQVHPSVRAAIKGVRGVIIFGKAPIWIWGKNPIIWRFGPFPSEYPEISIQRQSIGSS